MEIRGKKGLERAWRGRSEFYLVPIFPLLIEKFLCLDPSGHVVPQPGQNDLSQVRHLGLRRGLHFGIDKKASVGTDRVHLGDGHKNRKGEFHRAENG